MKSFSIFNGARINFTNKIYFHGACETSSYCMQEVWFINTVKMLYPFLTEYLTMKPSFICFKQVLKLHDIHLATHQNGYAHLFHFYITYNTCT